MIKDDAASTTSSWVLPLQASYAETAAMMLADEKGNAAF